MKPKRILLGVALGMAAVVVMLFLLARTLGNDDLTSVQGHPLSYWAAQVNAPEVVASNQANALLNDRIIPQLKEAMFHDTNDSPTRMNLVDALNTLPGIWIYYSAAPQRRAQAAQDLGSFGPAATGAIPALIEALQSSDEAVHAPAIKSLGAIHAEPTRVIPLLTQYLADERLNDEAATALGDYGSLARPAFTNILPLLHAPDKDARVAAAAALKKIDPEAYASATKASAK